MTPWRENVLISISVLNNCQDSLTSAETRAGGRSASLSSQLSLGALTRLCSRPVTCAAGSCHYWVHLPPPRLGRPPAPARAALSTRTEAGRRRRRGGEEGEEGKERAERGGEPRLQAGD